MTTPPEGYLEVGANDQGEIVVNHPDLKPDENGVGHIVFSKAQARNLANLLLKHAGENGQSLHESVIRILRGIVRCHEGGHPLGHDLVVAVRRIVLHVDGKLPKCNCTPCAARRKIEKTGGVSR